MWGPGRKRRKMGPKGVLSQYMTVDNITDFIDTPKIWLKMVFSLFELIIRHISMANKSDLIARVHETVGGTRADAERAVEAFIGGITETLKKGEEVSIAGLGIFEAKTRAGRTGRNPRTGETIQIKAMRVPKFRASKTLKDAIK